MTPRGRASCRRLTPLLGLLADGVLDDPAFAAEREELDEHLRGPAACADCNAALARERAAALSGLSLASLRAARTAPGVPIRVDVTQRVMASVRVEAARAAAPGFLRRLSLTLGLGSGFAVAANAAAVVLTALLLTQFPAIVTWPLTQGLRGLLFCRDLGTGALDIAFEMGTGALWMLSSIARALGGAFEGLAPAAAILFALALVTVTLIAVGRDLRVPAAAGVRR